MPTAPQSPLLLCFFQDLNTSSTLWLCFSSARLVCQASSSASPVMRWWTFCEVFPSPARFTAEFHAETSIFAHRNHNRILFIATWTLWWVRQAPSSRRPRSWRRAFFLDSFPHQLDLRFNTWYLSLKAFWHASCQNAPDLSDSLNAPGPQTSEIPFPRIKVIYPKATG